MRADSLIAAVFREKGCVSSVGYGVSEKAHDALKWLIARQGWHRDSLTIVCWENHLASLPSLLADTGNFFAAFAGEDEEEQYPNTGEAFARQLNLAMNGYRSRLATDSRIIVMGLDSAVSGKGRLAHHLVSRDPGISFLGSSGGLASRYGLVRFLSREACGVCSQSGADRRRGLRDRAGNIFKSKRRYHQGHRRSSSALYD